MGVAFLDVGVYVTSLRSVKNLLLIGDAVKSVMFAAFQVTALSLNGIALMVKQEDPYKLVIVSKDTRKLFITRSEFFFGEDDMNIITADHDGVLRLYGYNPARKPYCRPHTIPDLTCYLTDPESNDGRQLLLNTEFHAQAEYHSSLLVAKRPRGDPLVPETRLIFGESYYTRASQSGLTTLGQVPRMARLLVLASSRKMLPRGCSCFKVSSFATCSTLRA